MIGSIFLIRRIGLNILRIQYKYLEKYHFSNVGTKHSFCDSK